MKFVHSCKEYQFRITKCAYKEMYPTWPSYMFETCGIDIMYMEPLHSKYYLIILRNNLFGWCKARTFTAVIVQTVAKFL